MLRQCPRAKHGIAKGELIVDPPAVSETPRNGDFLATQPDMKIRVRSLDTLTAASWLSEKPSASQRTERTAPAVRSRSNKPNVAVLNMASAIRPGGGFLEGANSQEEYLCARSTLYPSLWDSYYRLPEVRAV